MLVEEYVEGEVVSLEVIGDGNNFAVVKETLIHIDETYFRLPHGNSTSS